MFVSPQEIETLSRSLYAQSGGLRLAVVPTTADPLQFVRAGAPLFGSAFYFSTPEGDAWAGLGKAWSGSAGGEARFLHLRDDRADAPTLPEPFRFFLGFSFAPDGPSGDEWTGFGAADLVLPQVSLGKVGGAAHLMVAGWRRGF